MGPLGFFWVGTRKLGTYVLPLVALPQRYNYKSSVPIVKKCLKTPFVLRLPFCNAAKLSPNLCLVAT